MKPVLDQESLEVVRKYVKQNINESVYLYLNLLNYDFNSTDVKLFIDGDIDEIKCVYLLYFHTLHILTNDSEPLSKDIYRVIDELDPTVIYIPKRISGCIESKLCDRYQQNEMHVYNYPDCGVKNSNLFEAKRSDYQRIADFLYESSTYKNSYSSKEELFNQLISRFDNNEGRYFFLIEDGNIVAVEGINAETPDIAVLGGLLVSPKMRGKGLAKTIKQGLHYILQQENKKIFCLINNPVSENMTIELGGYRVGTISKFFVK